MLAEGCVPFTAPLEPPEETEEDWEGVPLCTDSGALPTDQPELYVHVPRDSASPHMDDHHRSIII